MNSHLLPELQDITDQLCDHNIYSVLMCVL